MQIAIADDTPKDLEFLQTYICTWLKENQGLLTFSPALFTDGEALLESMKDTTYDIIFLDIYMNGINGMDTAKQIRQKDKQCRLVFTTSTSDFAAESYCVEASYYLVKPYTYENFSAAMERCFATLTPPLKKRSFCLKKQAAKQSIWKTLYIQNM